MNSEENKDKLNEEEREKKKSIFYYSSKIFFLNSHQILKSIMKIKFNQISKLSFIGKKMNYEEEYSSFVDFLESKPKSSFSVSFSKWIIKRTLPGLIMQIMAFWMTLGLPFLIKELIFTFTSPTFDPFRACLFSIYITTALIGRSILLHNGSIIVTEGIKRAIITLFSLYFEKLNKINIGVGRVLDINDLISGLQANLNRVVTMISIHHQIFIAPSLLILFSAILAIYVSKFSLIGMVTNFVLIIIQLILQKYLKSLYSRKNHLTELRNSVLLPLIQRMISVKYIGMEGKFRDSINILRDSEHVFSRKIIFIRGLLDSLAYLTPLLSSLSSIIISVTLGEKSIEIASLFFVIMIFNQLTFPLRVFAFSFVNLIETIINLKRISDFYDLIDEKRPLWLVNNANDLPLGSINFKEATFSYLKKEHFMDFERKDFNENSFMHESQLISTFTINSNIVPGKFTALVGKVGSGKSSFLHSIIGTFPLISGEIVKNGKILFLGQENFLFNKSIKENILMGREYNEERYNKILELCELKKDIETMILGDRTIIGVGGINISLGQKQRIEYARIFYEEADIYFLDESLTGIDQLTFDKIFNNLIKNELSGKTIVMSTNNVDHIEKADYVILMELGRVKLYGETQAVLSSLVDLELFSAERIKNDEIEGLLSDEEMDDVSEFNSVDYQHENNNMINFQHKEILIGKRRGHFEHKKRAESHIQVTVKQDNEKSKEPSLISNLLFYAKINGLAITVLCLILFSLGVLLRLFIDFWAPRFSKNDYSAISFEMSLLIYCLLALGTILMMLLRNNIWSSWTTEISKKIFSFFLENLMFSKISELEQVNIGNLMSLLSKDMEYVDSIFPSLLTSLITNFFQIVFTFILASVVFLPVLPIIILSLFIIKKFIKHSFEINKKIKKIELIIYNKVFKNIHELWEGIITIRCLRVDGYFREIFKDNVTSLCKVIDYGRLNSISTNFKLEVIISIYLLLMLEILVLAKNYKLPLFINDNTFISVLINWSMTLPLMIQFSWFLLSEAILGLAATNKIWNSFKKAPPTPKNVFLKNWPEFGKIQFFNVSFTFVGRMSLLNNVSFIIEPGQKVALVGRTGCGKSSLSNLLSRIVELPPNKSSNIEIDNISIDNIPLEQYFQNVTLLSSETFILKGTLRFNLNPLGELSDTEIISKLKEHTFWDLLFKSQSFQSSIVLQDTGVQLASIEEQGGLVIDFKARKNSIFNKPSLLEILPKSDNKTFDNEQPGLPDNEILDTLIENDGINLSKGQKQFIAFARVILKKPRVLVIDEAFSSIDRQFQYLIQDIILTKFTETTIIHISHQLESIYKYHRFLFLENGEIIGDGPFLELMLKNERFRDLVGEKGRELEKLGT